MSAIISSPIFSVMISLMAFEIGCIVYKKTKFPLFNPIIIAIVLVIIIIKLLNISLDTYNKGGNLISFFLTPATVILAVPLYKKLQLLKKNLVPIIVGIAAGSLSGMCSIILLCHLFLLPKQLTLSIIPKSVTVPIAVDVSKQIGGISTITIAAIIVSGTITIVVYPLVFKILKIKDPIAKGVALGTTANAVGTSKAIEMGEVEGAMSGLSIGLAGMFIVIFAPIVTKIFSVLIK
ncbi:antiholin-like protein LrgB [Clostridium pasteurianum DSM 525 = ATCC 6013]|uniref:Antiholin-like protein LrgB n=1 Tax=Clostridium pasteurianum DSM 525 = ATCC 6013 TaxID=1262449 RepID=A0A0H3IZX7_CLOPA|nr:LrgB family protein [Clostridium pasteurianum]AJA46604.1 antiholin-like protein LrgB [Clostridium pasteurianum DSM 525 = ATCC 6013]AJA50592.1 antiholin-like protein LrgB [Clostridium pasteurianum DSM 525 = ATCC 6013]ELP61170.1 LrgB family protein [Clostridium pasteurianum DSM 525 = ATCC 6013]KRU13396.1 LrgB family protein [Clostridium pasteurianum DSM 525 = ATCC 6013]